MLTVQMEGPGLPRSWELAADNMENTARCSSGNGWAPSLVGVGPGRGRNPQASERHQKGLREREEGAQARRVGLCSASLQTI